MVHRSMGVESGGTGGRVPRSQKISGGRSPRFSVISIFQYLFSSHMKTLHFQTFLKIKWLKSEEKLNFWGRWISVPTAQESVPPPPPNKNSWRRHCIGQMQNMSFSSKHVFLNNFESMKDSAKLFTPSCFSYPPKTSPGAAYETITLSNIIILT